MRKSVVALCLASFVFISCNWEIPKKVSISTKADFDLGIGSISFDMGSKIGPEEITQKINDSLEGRAAVYPFIMKDDESTVNVDESTILSYVVHYPLYEIPFDIGSKLDSLNFDESFNSTTNGFSFEQEIELPEVKFNETNSVEIPDFAQQVTDSIDLNLSAYGTKSFDVVEAANVVTPVSTLIPPITIASSVNFTYSGILYSNDSSFNITVTKTDSSPVSDDFKFSITAYIVDSDFSKTTIESPADYYSKTDEKELQNGETMVLPLRNETTGLPQSFKVVYVGRISGTQLVQHKYNVTISSNEFKIEKIFGVNATSDDIDLGLPDISQEIDLSVMSGYFESATIGTGSVSLIANRPDALKGSGINFSIDNLKLSGAGLGDLSFSGSPDPDHLINKTLDLSGKTLCPQPGDDKVRITGDIFVTFVNADIDLTTTTEGTKITIEAKGGVEKLSAAKINFNSSVYDGVQTDYSLTDTILPLDLYQTISQIDFPKGVETIETDGSGTKRDGKGFGLVCDVINTFPAENNIPFSVNSTTFNYAPAASSIPANTDYSPLDLTDSVTVDFIENPTDIERKVQFNVRVGESDNTLNLVNLEMGQKYKFGIKNAKLELDWNKAVLRASSTGSTTTGSSELNAFNINTVLDALPFEDEDSEKIDFDSIPTFFYFEKPNASYAGLGDLVDSLKVEGNISLTYSTGEEGSKTDHRENILGDEDQDEEIDFTASTMEWPAKGTTINATDEITKYFDKDYRTELDGKLYSVNTDLGNSLNSRAEDLKFNYKMKLSGSGNQGDIVVKHYMLERSGENPEASASLKVDLVVVIPLRLKLKGDITMSVMDFYIDEWETSDKDLLESVPGRGDSEMMDDFANAISHFGLRYELSTDLFEGINLKATFDDTKRVGSSGVTKEIPFSLNRKNQLAFNRSEINRIWNSEIFHPDISLMLEGGTDSEPAIFTLKNSLLDESNKDAGKIFADFAVILKMNGEPITVWGGDE